MIKVTDVTKYFDDFKVLDDISMHVRRGTIYGLIGPNGAGKTTIINHINGVLTPKCGEIKINGEPVFENEKVKQSVLNISDDWFYYSTFTIKEMARFYRNIYPAFSNERYEAIKGIFKLDEKRQIRKLSKGMKKQVAFWLSLSAMPDVLILDEPLDGLDPVMRKQVLNLVIADVADREMTVLVSSHNLRELEDICDHLVLLHKGEMLFECDIDSLKDNVRTVQAMFKDPPEDLFCDGLSFGSISRRGSMISCVVKGDESVCRKYFDSLSPEFYELIPLSLEEIFITEMEEKGYDANHLIG